MQISQEALKEAYAEINALREERQQGVGWDDDVYQFCADALGDPLDRKRGRVTWDDIANVLNERSWMTGSPRAIAQAFNKERRRRKLNEGE